MKAKMFLIMIIVAMMISVPAAASVEKKPFIGLVPMVGVGAANLDVAAKAVLTKPVETTLGGAEYVCIAGGTLVDLTLDGANAVLIAGSNLDVALKAVTTKPVETLFGGVKLLGGGVDLIRRGLFGNPRK